MEATKVTAFIAGIVIAIIATIVEVYNLPSIIIAIVFIPIVLIFVVGKELWREWLKGEHISSGPMVFPKDAEGWKIYGRAWYRMLLGFIGAAGTGIGLSVLLKLA